MTDKQMIKLKPIEDLNEKIIKEKGNTKCIFYADDICRNGDKTRDCVNCARIEYRSLYKLNWNNQDRLFRQLDQLESENDLLRKTHKTEQDRRRAYEQALTEIKEIAEYDFKELMNAEDYHNMTEVLEQILQKCEVLDE